MAPLTVDAAPATPRYSDWLLDLTIPSEGFGHGLFGHGLFGHGEAGGPIYLATRDVVVSGQLYLGEVADPPRIRRETTNTFYGFQEVQTVIVRVKNTNGQLDALWSLDLRGVHATIRRHDPAPGSG